MQPTGLMGRNQLFVSRLSSIKDLQQAASNVLLAWVSHEKTHGPMAEIEMMLEAATNVIKRALKNIVPLTTNMHAWAEPLGEGRLEQPVPCAASCPSQWASCEHQGGNETRGACICHFWATESMALAPDQCAQTSDDTRKTWPVWQAPTFATSLFCNPSANIAVGLS